MPKAERKTVIFITHEISEAVFLADRVVVMSNNPGSVKSVVPIDLPRPRAEAMRAHPVAQQIWGMIKDEAYRAIAGRKCARQEKFRRPESARRDQ